jgi:hypothetical protein
LQIGNLVTVFKVSACELRGKSTTFFNTASN